MYTSSENLSPETTVCDSQPFLSLSRQPTITTMYTSLVPLTWFTKTNNSLCLRLQQPGSRKYHVLERNSAEEIRIESYRWEVAKLQREGGEGREGEKRDWGCHVEPWCSMGIDWAMEMFQEATGMVCSRKSLACLLPPFLPKLNLGTPKWTLPSLTEPRPLNWTLATPPTITAPLCYDHFRPPLPQFCTSCPPWWQCQTPFATPCHWVMII